MKYRLLILVVMNDAREVSREHWVQKKHRFLFWTWWENTSFSFFKERENAIKDLRQYHALPLREETIIYKYL